MKKSTQNEENEENKENEETINSFIRNLSILHVPKLKSMCKSRNIKRTYKMKKSELLRSLAIAMSQESQEIEESNEDEPSIVNNTVNIITKNIDSDIVITDPLNIIHLADTHIDRTLDFTHLREYMKTIPYGSVVVIAGDIFHKYDKLNSQIIPCFYDLLRIFHKQFITIIIPGNHDLKNPHVDGSILPWFPSIIENVIYIEPKIIYGINNSIFFAHIPYWDAEPSLAISEQFTKTSNKPIIGIYHDTIYGSTMNESGYEFKDDSLREAMTFDHFDICMLGHIHTHQFISEKMAYPGSLFQMNFGESIDNKGLIRWIFDIKNRKILSSQHIDIFGDHIYLIVKDDLMRDFDNIPAINDRIKYLKSISFRFNDEIDKQQVNNFKIKYLNIHVKTVKGLYSMLDTFRLQNDKQDVHIDGLTSYRTYISNLSFDTTQKTKIVDKFIAYMKLAEDENDDNELSSWRITRLRFMNIFAFGNDEMNDIRIGSDGNIFNIAGFNGVGKSSILSIILYALFSAGMKADVMNKHSKSFKLILDFTYGDDKYRLIKGGSKRGEDIRNTNELIRNGTQLSVSISWITKQLKIMIGGVKYFLLANVYSNVAGINFTDLSETDRAKILSEMFHVDIYNRMYKMSASEYKEIVAKINTISGSINELESIINDNKNCQSELLELKTNLVDVEKSISEYQDAGITSTFDDNRLMTLTKEIADDKSQQLQVIYDDISDLTLKINLLNLTSTKKKLNDLESNNTFISEIEQLESKLSTDLPTKDELVSKKTSLHHAIIKYRQSTTDSYMRKIKQLESAIMSDKLIKSINDDNKQLLIVEQDLKAMSKKLNILSEKLSISKNEDVKIDGIDEYDTIRKMRMLMSIPISDTTKLMLSINKFIDLMPEKMPKMSDETRLLRQYYLKTRSVKIDIDMYDAVKKKLSEILISRNKNIEIITEEISISNDKFIDMKALKRTLTINISANKKQLKKLGKLKQSNGEDNQLLLISTQTQLKNHLNNISKNVIPKQFIDDFDAIIIMNKKVDSNVRIQGKLNILLDQQAAKEHEESALKKQIKYQLQLIGNVNCEDINIDGLDIDTLQNQILNLKSQQDDVLANAIIPEKFRKEYQMLISERNKNDNQIAILTKLNTKQTVLTIEIKNKTKQVLNIDDMLTRRNKLSETLTESKYNLNIVKAVKLSLSPKQFPTFVINHDLKIVIQRANNILTAIDTGLTLELRENKLYFIKDNTGFPIKIASGYETLI